MSARTKRGRAEDANGSPAARKQARKGAGGAAPASGAGAGAGAGSAASSAAAASAADPRTVALEQFKLDAECCEQMIPIIGSLYRKQNIVTILYGTSLTNKSALEIARQHAFAATHFSHTVSVQASLRILRAATRVSLQPMKLDVGRAAVLYQAELSGPDDEAAVRALVTKLAVHAQAEAKPATAQTTAGAKPRDVVLYGFGRIGRLVARVLIEKTGAGSKMVLRAIVVRPKPNDLKKRLNLLINDSVHGTLDAVVTMDEEAKTITANGNVIQLIYNSKTPADVDYTAYGISGAVVIDNTGIWRDAKGLGQHLQSKGVDKVILTSPGKGVTTVVAGVNDDRVEDSVNIYAAASCTTNAIVPLLKTMDETYGVESGHLETVHSYTNDQNLIDNYHKKTRRGRSAALNMVLTETGAAKAVAQSLPGLAGKLTGNAIRVPTPNVSMAILILQLREKTTRDELNHFLFKQATYGPYCHQIGYSVNEDGVSSDFVGARSTGVIDAPATIVNGNRVNLYVWYDNEFGYACQVIRVLQRVSGVVFGTFPRPGAAASSPLVD